MDYKSFISFFLTFVSYFFEAQIIINEIYISCPLGNIMEMEKPLKILHGSLNNRVMVELRGGRSYHGTLDGYDVPHMNLVLKNAEEMANGEATKKHATIIVRGDNIIYVSP